MHFQIYSRKQQKAYFPLWMVVEQRRCLRNSYIWQALGNQVWNTLVSGRGADLDSQHMGIWKIPACLVLNKKKWQSFILVFIRSCKDVLIVREIKMNEYLYKWGAKSSQSFIIHCRLLIIFVSFSRCVTNLP